MSVTVTTNITVKIQGRTIELSLEEAKVLYAELGKICAPYPTITPNNPYNPYNPYNPSWTLTADGNVPIALYNT